MLTTQQLEKMLHDFGYAEDHRTLKVIAFQKDDKTVYLKRISTSHPLVIHSKHASKIPDLLGLSGVVRTKSTADPYHNANMRSFDLRQNRGAKPTRYGYDFNIRDEKSLANLLNKI
jgi:hypothetical protein